LQAKPYAQICPKGGVLYAQEARTIAHKKEEDDAQKKVENAQKQLEKAKKEAIRERKKIWKPIFQELKRSTPKPK